MLPQPISYCSVSHLSCSVAPLCRNIAMDGVVFVEDHEVESLGSERGEDRALVIYAFMNCGEHAVPVPS